MPCSAHSDVTAPRSNGFPSVWAIITARVRGPTAAARAAGSTFPVAGSTSTNTGTRPFCRIGLTVVGKPAATVSTSSPGFKARSSSFGDVSADSASRLADEPLLHSSACRSPTKRDSPFSRSRAKRPVVSQKSSADSTSDTISSASNTRPDTGTGVSPGTNRRSGCSSV